MRKKPIEKSLSNSAEDPGFLERGFNMYKGVGVRFVDFISFFFNIP